MEQRRADLGLDRSYPVQYFAWLGGLARLDAGDSLVSGIPVSEEVTPRIAVTIELSLLALALAGVTGAVTGVVAAGARGGRFDAGASAASMAGLSAPAFWLGLLVVLALAIWFDVFVAARLQADLGRPGRQPPPHDSVSGGPGSPAGSINFPGCPDGYRRGAGG